MAFRNNPTTTGTPANVPVGSVAVPNHANGDLTALRGASASTDGNGNETAAVATVVENANINGQATMANSSPVALASNQPGLSQMANSDGVVQTNVLEEAIWLYNSGGPVDTTGKPQQLSGDRLRAWQGKNVATGTITTSVSGDANLVFSVAPKTIMPGQGIVLSGAATPEVVYVTTAYVPSNTATTIPLQTTVVSAGQTTAKWDQFHPYGGNAGIGLTHFGVLPSILVVQDAGSGANGLNALINASVDGASKSQVLLEQQGLYNGTTVDRQRGPTTFKSFNAQALTATTANTPTSIWTPAAGKKFRLMGYWFSLSAAAGLVFHDLASLGGGGVMPVPSPLAAAAGIVQSPPIGNGILSAAANNQLWIDATAAATVTGFVWGTEE